MSYQASDVYPIAREQGHSIAVALGLMVLQYVMDLIFT